jgi:hypothetical protein
MADEQKQKAEKQDANLELNRETVQDLTEQEAENVQGGLLVAAGSATNYAGGCRCQTA